MPHQPDLVELYHRLPITDAALGTFNAVPIPDYDQHRLARSSSGYPSVLLYSRDVETTSYSTPVVLEHITVSYDQECRVTRPGLTAEEGRFTIVSCGGPRYLENYFLQVIAALIAAIGNTPSKQDVRQAVDAMIELFRSLSRPPKQSVQGLWAEVFLISKSTNPALMAEAWHAYTTETYDFASGEERIEVKSTSGRTRTHYFSLEQLRPPPGSRVVVASVFVERSGAGSTLNSLIANLRTRLTDRPDLILKIETLVGATLGAAVRHGMAEGFDLELARASLRIYAASAIPSFDGPLPDGVSEVRFRADLEEVDELDRATLSSSPLFDSIGDVAEGRD